MATPTENQQIRLLRVIPFPLIAQVMDVVGVANLATEPALSSLFSQLL
jgi:hypothetical protein